MTYNEARNRATKKYVKKAYDSVTFRVKKRECEKLQQIAASQGESVNAFITKAIQERIDRLHIELNTDYNK